MSREISSAAGAKNKIELTTALGRSWVMTGGVRLACTASQTKMQRLMTMQADGACMSRNVGCNVIGCGRRLCEDSIGTLSAMQLTDVCRRGLAELGSCKLEKWE